MSVSRHCALNRDKSREFQSAQQRYAPGVEHRLGAKYCMAMEPSRPSAHAFATPMRSGPVADGNPDRAHTKWRNHLSQPLSLRNELKVPLPEYCKV